MSEGTPKSLDEAIIAAMCVGPASEGKDRIKAAVRDFLAQKFTTALMSARHPIEERAIANLWCLITEEEKLNADD